MAYNWTVKDPSYKGKIPTVIDREAAHAVDKAENRRRLYANELNCIMAYRAAFYLLEASIDGLEKLGKETKVWWRMKGLTKQLANVFRIMLNRTSSEQIAKIKHNTTHTQVSVRPQAMPDSELINLPLSEHERLLCASLAYCQEHCDGCTANQRKCKIKSMLDDSVYMQDMEVPVLVPGMCRYAMVNAEWDKIRSE